MQDWKTAVGTGPYMLTDWVKGSSLTYTKNPNYWGYDEKFPENRLPYLDEVKVLVIPDFIHKVVGAAHGQDRSADQRYLRPGEGHPEDQPRTLMDNPHW